MSDKILIIGAVILTVCGALIALIEKLLSKKPKTKEEEIENRNKRLIGLISFVIVLTGAGLSYYSNYKSFISKERSQHLQDSLTRKNSALNDSIIKLANIQIDTAMKIISLNEKLNESQAELNASQKAMINLQSSYFEKLSGGNNKPIVRLSRFVSPIEFNGHRVVFPNLILENVGKTYLKDVEVWINDPYKGVSKVLYEGQYNRVVIKGTDTVSENTPYFIDENGLPNSHASTITTKNVNVLPPNQPREIYATILPENATDINYGVFVSWSNGSYSMKISGKYYEGYVYIRVMNYFFDDGTSTSIYKFSNLKRTIPDGFKVCKPAKFMDEIYDVYWNEELQHVVFGQRGSIYLDGFPVPSASSSDKATDFVMRKLEEVFKN